MTAQVRSAEAPRSVRVYFRASDQSTEYYLEMMKGSGDDYWAILPIPDANTASVVYRVVARDSHDVASSTEAITVPVALACAGADLNAEESRYASNLSLGLTADSQPSAPTGFRCVGIQNQISATGEVVTPNDICRQVLLTGNDKCKGGVWIPGSAAAIVAAGAAVAVGGAVIYKNGRGHQKPVSSLRP